MYDVMKGAPRECGYPHFAQVLKMWDNRIGYYGSSAPAFLHLRLRGFSSPGHRLIARALLLGGWMYPRRHQLRDARDTRLLR
jgi:hypothetical protein